MCDASRAVSTSVKTHTAALLLITAVWGATFVTVKDALDASDTFTFLALRFAAGAVTGEVHVRQHVPIRLEEALFVVPERARH